MYPGKCLLDPFKYSQSRCKRRTSAPPRHFLQVSVQHGAHPTSTVPQMPKDTPRLRPLLPGPKTLIYSASSETLTDQYSQSPAVSSESAKAPSSISVRTVLRKRRAVPVVRAMIVYLQCHSRSDIS